MPAYTITDDKARKCIGKIVARKSLTFGEFLRKLNVAEVAANEEIGLVLEWVGDKAKRLPGFDLEITAGERFNFSRETHIDVKQIGGLDQPVDQHFDEARSRNHIGAGRLKITDTLTFKTTLNTDSPQLLGGIGTLEAKALQTRKPAIFAGKGTSSSEPYKIEVILGDYVPQSTLTTILRARLYRAGVGALNAIYWVFIVYKLEELQPYDGLAAIDCGNSGCSLAIKSSVPTSVESIEMVSIDVHYRDVDERSRTPMLKSAVYLTQIQPRRDEGATEEQRKLWPVCTWESGEAALEMPDERGLVVSPKRYLGKSHLDPINLDGKTLSSHLPLELLLTSVLKEAHFRVRATMHQETGRGQPGMTLTYPSTFSRPEILRLRDIYLAAVQRAMPPQCQCQSFSPPTPKLIDEACAAAFYFLYRDFFFSAGQIPAFQYIYPDGANVLVMDFGGGTTDVALVRCVSKGADGSQSIGDDCTVSLEVLGRTGLRSFGGDIITCAVFRVLKAAVAAQITRVGLEPRTEGESFLDWYKRQTGIDAAVPTIFEGIPDEDVRPRRQLTKDFWYWSEKVKQWLSSNGTPEEFPQPVGGSNLDVWLKQAGPVDSGARGRMAPRVSPGNVANWLTEELPKTIREQLPDVNSQIQKDLDGLMAKVNQLLREKLSEVTNVSTFHELHRAYIVGQAAHFPAIRNSIEKQLAIQIINHDYREKEPDWVTEKDLDVRRILFDRRELKYSVAKGAVLFNFVTTSHFEAKFEKDDDLPDRLPFVILFHTAKAMREVYAIDDDFKRMKQDWEPMPNLKIDEADGSRIVRLRRRWPGDDSETEPEAFFIFSIDRLVNGPLKIKYVETDSYIGFVLRDFGGDDREIKGSWVEPDETIPPMQRGDL